MTTHADPPPDALLHRAQQGDRRALARLISLVERAGPAADAVDEATFPASGRAHVIGITGAPGTGKSTITGRLSATLAAAGRSVGIIAVDPSSPLSGGAILGDRVRMDEHVHDHAVFIRSMATRGSSGGLALAVPGAVRALDAAGFDAVIVETVGVGQTEVAIAGAADTVVAVVTPGWGDAIQANKAGLLELADVFVVNKADRPGVADAVRDLERMLDLGYASSVPGEPACRPRIVTTTATEGTGIDTLADALDAHINRLRSSGALATRRARLLRAETRARALALLGHRLDHLHEREQADRILAEVESRRLPPWSAARALVELAANGPGTVSG